MPTYAKGTRQWAEQQIARIRERCEEHLSSDDEDMYDAAHEEWEVLEEMQEMLDKGLPEGTPIYSKAELEANGQEVLL